MEKINKINWNMIGAIAMCIGIFSWIGGCLRNSIAIVDTPAQQIVLADRLYQLETNSAVHFEHNDWHNEKVDQALVLINQKLDTLSQATVIVPNSLKGQDQNNK